MLRNATNLIFKVSNLSEDVIFRQVFRSTGYKRRLFANFKGPFKLSGSTKSSDSRCKDIVKDGMPRTDGGTQVFAENSRPKPSTPDFSQNETFSESNHPEDRQSGSRKVIIFGSIVTFLVACTGVLYWLDAFSKNKIKSKKKLTKHQHAENKMEEILVQKNPAKSSDIPDNVPYLLIGGGTASFAAFTAIRSADPDAKVLIISRESHYPYMRFPLSKEMLYTLSTDNGNGNYTKLTQRNGVETSVYYEPPEFYSDCKTFEDLPHGGVAVARGWTVKKLDVLEKKAYLEDGYVISYDKCLIATGCTPKTLSSIKEAPVSIQSKIMTYRGIEDLKTLLKDLKEGAKSIAIVGGTFLGSELAYNLVTHLKSNKLYVSQIFLEHGNMGNILPPYLSTWTMNSIVKKGVKVYNNAWIEGVSLDKDKLVLSLSTGEEIMADKVILAVGVEPNTELAITSELETDKQHGGFVVNSELMARSDLWAAGDCSCFFDPQSGRRRRVSSHDNAMESGKAAGENMTGAAREYDYQSIYWANLGHDIGFEGLGIIDASLPTVSVFTVAGSNNSPKTVVAETNEADRSKTEKKVVSVVPAQNNPETLKTRSDYGKGVIFYLRDDIIVGILLWNVFHRLNIARKVLREKKRYEDLNEVAKLFNIHMENDNLFIN